MTEAEAEIIIERMSKIWNWNPTVDALRLWKEMLVRFDYNDAYVAVKDYWEKSKRATPPPGGIKEAILSKIRRREGHDFKQSEPGLTDVFVQCVEPDPRFPYRVGRYVPVCYGSKAAVPDDRDIILRQAEEIRNANEHLYGEKWIVVQGSSLTQMETSRQGLLNKKGLI